MRINEIITESLDEQVLDEYSHMDKAIYDALKKKGYKYLGSGVDQSAFIEPGTGFVLKIFGTDKQDKFSQDHKMFFKWYEFCTKHQKNKFLPRFYGHESFLWKDKNYVGKPHRYLMIRTEPLRESNLVGRDAAKLADLVAQHGGNTTRALASFESFYKDQTARLYQALGNNMDDIYLLADTMGKLFKMGDKKDWGWDLHHGNIMLRADGTPVINDPWVV